MLQDVTGHSIGLQTSLDDGVTGSEGKTSNGCSLSQNLDAAS